MFLKTRVQIALVYFIGIEFDGRERCNLQDCHTISFEKSHHSLSLMNFSEALDDSFANVISSRGLLKNAKSFEG